MALAKKSSSSSRFIIVGVVIIVVAGIGYLLWREFFLKTDTVDPNAAGVAGSKKVITDFHESILNDPRYTILKSYDQSVNVNAGSDGGQINPFQ